MSFKEALAAEKPRRQCKVCDLEAVLDPEDWNDLTESLADDTINSASITRALAAIGHRMSEHTVKRHRTGGCE